MKIIRDMVMAGAASLAFTTAAQGTTVINVGLTNGQETLLVVPTLSNGITPRPVSFGDATLVFNDALTALTYTINVFNIDFTGAQTADVNDNLLAAHIHAGLNVTPTTNGPVVFGFFGAPLNENAGDLAVTAFTNGVGGTISGKWDAAEGNNTTLTAQLNNLLNGRAYLNFHTVQFGGGEIRGNFSSAVPEPATWAMMMLGFGMVGYGLRRRPFPALPLSA